MGALIFQNFPGGTFYILTLNIKRVSQIQGVFILIDFFLGYIKLDFIITDYLNKRRFNETFWGKMFPK